MKKCILLIAVVLEFSCSSKNVSENKSLNLENPIKSSFEDSVKNEKQNKNFAFYGISLKADSAISYIKIKSEINQLRLRTKQQNISEDSLSNLFLELLVNKIIPYWYGTKWSFEGHTAIPRTGEIACGYFVSTTLKHMGIKINRYKMAQQSPINEAKTLAFNQAVIEIENATVQANIKALKDTLQEGIYFIGFDASHVGYILKKKNALFLIHSNYFSENGVEIEKIEQSQAFASFNKFYISAISTNKTLLENWQTGKEISIKTD